MKVQRCSTCGEVKELTFAFGELPAQFVDICKCNECSHQNKQIRAIPNGIKIICLDCGKVLEEGK